jgi:uncharacterized protein YnzC (UPF0291/DUF896 family)
MKSSGWQFCLDIFAILRLFIHLGIEESKFFSAKKALEYVTTFSQNNCNQNWVVRVPYLLGFGQVLVNILESGTIVDEYGQPATVEKFLEILSAEGFDDAKFAADEFFNQKLSKYIKLEIIGVTHQSFHKKKIYPRFGIKK